MENKDKKWEPTGWSEDANGWKCDENFKPLDVPDYTAPVEGYYTVNGKVMHLKPGDVIKLDSEGQPYIS